MATRGRKSEEKVWGTRFRHVFNTNYLVDPDLHILLFVTGGDINVVMRQALREYMDKHASKATDPEFQARIFMQASIKVAKGVCPTAKEVLGELSAIDSTAIEVDAIVASAKVEVRPSPAPAPAASSASAPVARSPKPRVVLDFGPELEMETEGDEKPKPSLREKWLAQNKQ
jgi:hypothetical protein